MQGDAGHSFRILGTSFNKKNGVSLSLSLPFCMQVTEVLIVPFMRWALNDNGRNLLHLGLAARLQYVDQKGTEGG
jgi:hypothetical protein